MLSVTIFCCVSKVMSITCCYIIKSNLFNFVLLLKNRNQEKVLSVGKTLFFISAVCSCKFLNFVLLGNGNTGI